MRKGNKMEKIRKTRIDKDTKLGEIKMILNEHGINTPFEWDFIFGNF